MAYLLLAVPDDLLFVGQDEEPLFEDLLKAAGGQHPKLPQLEGFPVRLHRRRQSS